jgi:adenylate cyclase
MERRLAAVLIADVVGYSRLSQKDEEGTRASFRSDLGEVFEPRIAAHRGRFIKTMGDGLLVEFSSVVDAVRCAVDIQRNKVERNADVTTPLVYRIGINLGDIIIEGNDIHGDGVNIADRIQGLADHGGIALSGAAYDQVKSKVDVGFAFLGERALKNIADPVRLYKVLLDPAETGKIIDTAAVSKFGPLVTEAGSSDPKLSIAILPFSNMSGDKEQDYFSDGITEDIITEISRFRELRVIARKSSFAFRTQNLEIAEIARRLNVQFVVEGSVRKAGNRLRITAQLIEAGSDRHIWAERYDRALDDIFSVQDEIARTVATIAAGQVKVAAAARSHARPTESLSAYDLFLRARATLVHYQPGDMKENEELLTRAIALDPKYAMAHAMMAATLNTMSLYDGDRERRERAVAFARRAIGLDPSEPWSHGSLGYCFTYLRRGIEAGVHFERARQLNPNDGFMAMLYANSLCYVGQVDKALVIMAEALERDPFGHDWFWDVYCIALVAAGKCREALATFDRIAVRGPWTYAYAAIAHVGLNDIASARSMVDLCRQEFPKLTPDDYLRAEPYTDQAVTDRLVADLGMAL